MKCTEAEHSVVTSLEAAVDRLDDLTVEGIADAIQSIGFECTRCGACCTAFADEPHTATVFPGEVRAIQDETDADWDAVARPMPYGLEAGEGETIEWALQTDQDGDCTFHETDNDQGSACGIYGARPLICQTYPFSLDLEGTAGRNEAVVEREGVLTAYECPGLGRDIDRDRARQLAETLLRRTSRELEEAMGVRDAYEPGRQFDERVVVHDSEGAKRADGVPIDERNRNKD